MNPDEIDPESGVMRLRGVRERLLARFPGAGIYHPSLTDKDQDHVTSDRRAHQGVRKFYLGEVFWCGPMEGLRVPEAAMRPAMVTRRQTVRCAPVEMAPSARLRQGNEGDPSVFVPQDGLQHLAEESAFLLFWRRPVSRDLLGGHLDTLSGKDKQRLANQLAKLGQRLD